MGHMVECGDAKNGDEDDKTPPLSCWSVQHGQSVVSFTWQLPCMGIRFGGCDVVNLRCSTCNAAEEHRVGDIATR